MDRIENLLIGKNKKESECIPFVIPVDSRKGIIKTWNLIIELLEEGHNYSKIYANIKICIRIKYKNISCDLP